MTSIKVATLEDVESILDLIQRLSLESAFIAYGNYANERKMLVNTLKDKRSNIWMLFEGDVLIGYLLMESDKGDYTIRTLTIGIMARYCGLGNGTILIGEALKQALNTNARQLKLWCHSKNNRAKNFYSKFGFKSSSDISSDYNFMIMMQLNLQTVNV